MSYHREEFIRSRVKALSILIRGVEEDEDGHEINPLTEHALDRLIRMLRPTNHQIQDYAKAVKIRLRQSILNHPHINTVTGTTSNEGPLLLARFDKEVETFGRMNPALIHSYLVLLKPLSFYEPPKRLLENQGRRVRKTLPTVVTGSVSQSQYTPASTLHSRQILSAEEKLQQQIHSSSSHNQLFNQRNGLNKGLYEDPASSSVRISITNPPPPPAHRPTSTTIAASGSSTKTSTTIPVDTSVTPNTTLNSQQIAMHWVNPDVERKLLIDLVYILQVRNTPLSSFGVSVTHSFSLSLFLSI
jgi:hypothetical protein